MARAIWKGSISFGLVNVPVSLITAEKRDELQLHLLDRRDRSPVRYVRVNQSTGEEVPWEETVKGYEHEEGVYVVLTDEDFRRANVEATETVEIVDFVKAQDIDILYVNTPYYLEPRKEGRKAYALLRETLRRTGQAGIAKVVIRTRQYPAAVVVRGDVLVLELLRYAHELRDPAELDVPGENLAELGVTDKELDMAERLVDAMVAEWNPSQYRDEYREDLLELVRDRVKHGDLAPVVPAPAAERRGAEVVDIMGLLKKSVEAAAGKGNTVRGRRRRASGAGRSH